MLNACESAPKVVREISDEHAALFGTWEEKDSVNHTIWVFDRYEVKWNGFTHVYEVSGDSLIISGMVYRIIEQSDKGMKIKRLNGKECILNRKQ